MLRILPPILMGALAGMLVNYLSDHLPVWRQLGPSRCPDCEARQPWVNYFLWPRRCPFCGWSHRLRSFSVDLFCLGGSLWLWQSPPGKLGLLAGYLLMIFFLTVVVIDLEHRLILHPVSLAGVVLGLVVGVWSRGLVSTLVGGAVGFGTMLMLYYLGGVFTRLAARLRGDPVDEVALGFGDVNLAGVLGLLLGWPGILVGLFLGILAGGAISFLHILVTLLAGRYRSFAAIPYAPYLVLGAVLLLYFPDAAQTFLGGISPFLTGILN